MKEKGKLSKDVIEMWCNANFAGKLIHKEA